jgi:hypothetical protein
MGQAASSSKEWLALCHCGACAAYRNIDSTAIKQAQAKGATQHLG